MQSWVLDQNQSIGFMIQIKYWISRGKVKLIFIKLGPIYLVTIYLLYEWFYKYLYMSLSFFLVVYL